MTPYLFSAEAASIGGGASSSATVTPLLEGLRYSTPYYYNAGFGNSYNDCYSDIYPTANEAYAVSYIPYEFLEQDNLPLITDLSADDEYYDYVVNTSPYQHTDDIKEKANQIYSANYLASIYEGLFTGVTVSNQAGGTLYARYRDYEEDGYYYLQECNQVTGYDLPERRYDYTTMQMQKGSNARYITISIESYILGNEQSREVVELSFALENGNWYLDTPSY
jgi:hypothetical protein